MIKNERNRTDIGDALHRHCQPCSQNLSLLFFRVLTLSRSVKRDYQRPGGGPSRQCPGGPSRQ